MFWGNNDIWYHYLLISFYCVFTMWQVLCYVFTNKDGQDLSMMVSLKCVLLPLRLISFNVCVDWANILGKTTACLVCTEPPTISTSGLLWKSANHELI